MYRFVKLSGIKLRRIKHLPHQCSSRICSSCGIKNASLIPNLKSGINNPSLVFTRTHNTDTDAIVINNLTKRKQFQRNKKFFTELLEVFVDTSNQTKAAVENLKAKDISHIAVSRNIELDGIHKMRKKTNKRVVKQHYCTSASGESNRTKMNRIANHKVAGLDDATANNITLPETNLINQSKFKNDPEINWSSLKSDYVDELHEEINQSLSDFNETLLPSVLNIPYEIEAHFKEEYETQNEESDILEELMNTKDTHSSLQKPQDIQKRKVGWKRTTKDKLAKDKISDLENKCKEKAFNTTLHTYINLCVSCDYLQRGLATLNCYFYRSQKSHKNPKITDIRIFELLTNGFAAKGNYSKVTELWDMLIAAKIEPSLAVFAARLECAARSPTHRDAVPDIIAELKDRGHQLNDLFVKCTFIRDQREIIMKAIQEVEDGFQPVIPLPSICYSCSLLQEINDHQGKNCNLRSPSEGIMSKANLQKFAEEQFKNEFEFDLKVQSIEKRIEPEGVLELNRKKLDSMRVSWMEDLKKGFERDVTILKMINKPSCLSLYPYMKVLDAQSYVDIMMKEVQKLAEGSETFSPSTLLLYKLIGNQVRNRCVIKMKKTHGVVSKTKMLYDKYCDWYLDPSANNRRSLNGRQEWLQLLNQHQSGASVVGDEDYWPSTVLIGIGKFLYNIIVSDVKIDVNILNKHGKEHMLPAFYRVYRQQGSRSVEEIKPHPVISKLFRAAGEPHILFDITLVPMLCPPLPWTSHLCGGYLTAKTDIIRLPDQALQQRQRLMEAPPEQLYPPLDSLNQLGAIPWRVNKPVLDTVIEVFNNGGSSVLEIPEPPHACPVSEPVHPTMSKEERYQAYKQRIILRRQKAEMYSLWCDALYKLSLANHFRDRIFWLPHNMDFRGRVYPCPPHLNHLGSDMPRSLLCFAQGKPLGPDGLDWLKIHLVNLLGTKKRESVQERLDYANSILPDILDSAEKPLTGGKWWQASETPWQTLSCCMEIRAALAHPAGPEQFVSHFPVHQDGSCNGLQHYAALGRDQHGAASVNLTAQPLPQDVYSCVAALVERERAKDSANGVAVAKELDGFVRRKVIKQTVMTTVYGVTRFGARLQIAKQLKDIDSFPKEYVWPASSYLVVKTFESLREMFKSTREIQDWFTECARLVSHICGENMEYVTPLGLPVVQYYSRQTQKHNFKVNNIGHLHQYFPIDMFERPNVMKQKNAFPPNFIHSLDSSHMMLTSILTEQAGITFVSVHDCYWTHASTVYTMNRICREQFVALHSQPILEDLSEFMLNRYNYNGREKLDSNSSVSQAKQKLHRTLGQVPPKGSFILEEVLDSVYFFS